MAFTDVQIANMALGNVGVSKQIAALGEQSNEANVCNLYYQPSLESALEDFPWPEATGYDTPGLVKKEPNDDWNFAYRYPTDCLMVRRIVTVLGRRDPDPPPFRIGRDSTGRLIYTDEEAPTVEMTVRISDAAQFSALFAEALSWRLAAFIAPALSRIKDMQKTALVIYSAVLARARVRAANEQQQPEPPVSDLERARE